MLRTPRLLPVVIAAATALLLLKGVGLVTSGGYVLTGTGAATAAGAGAGGAPAAGGSATAVDPTMTLPTEATMADTSPTLADKAPELNLSAEAAASAGHGATEAAATEGEHGAVAAEADPPEPVEANGEQLQAACPPDAPTLEEPGKKKPDIPPESAAMAPKPNCIPVPLNEYGDAIAMGLNAEGKLAPIETTESSRDDLLASLGDRRGELEAREKELEMRMALVEAAEQRIEERTAVLKGLEAQISALVEQRKSDEKEQFASIVAMYESMRPKEAATLLNALDNEILLRVARAMNPRRMAPILARMDPMKAKTLTAALARQEAEPMADTGAIEDLASLPQIVGQ